MQITFSYKCRSGFNAPPGGISPIYPAVIPCMPYKCMKAAFPPIRSHDAISNSRRSCMPWPSCTGIPWLRIHFMYGVFSYKGATLDIHLPPVLAYEFKSILHIDKPMRQRLKGRITARVSAAFLVWEIPYDR